MDPQSHFEFFTRALLLLVIFLLRQLPSRYNININSQQFLDSMTMHVGSEPTSGRPWRLAPTGLLNETDTRPETDARARARDRFVCEYYPHVARAIPSAPNTFHTPVTPTVGRQRGTKRPAHSVADKHPRKRTYFQSLGMIIFH